MIQVHEDLKSSPFPAPPSRFPPKPKPRRPGPGPLAPQAKPKPARPRTLGPPSQTQANVNTTCQIGNINTHVNTILDLITNH